MSFKLTKNQKEEIVDDYGMNLNAVDKIVSILNGLDFPFVDEEDFIYTVSEVVSKLETERFQKEQGEFAACRAKYTIHSAITKTLVEKISTGIYSKDALFKVMTGLEQLKKRN